MPTIIVSGLVYQKLKVLRTLFEIKEGRTVTWNEFLNKIITEWYSVKKDELGTELEVVLESMKSKIEGGD